MGREEEEGGEGGRRGNTIICAHLHMCSEGLKNAAVLREVREQLEEEKRNMVSQKCALPTQ